jgi:sarcosine oxidase, subunit delta
MLLIHCPYCEERLPELEFAYAGEAHSDAEWERYLFIRANPKGRHHERWRHIHGCGRFFNAVRNTVSDKFEVTYKAGEPRR